MNLAKIHPVNRRKNNTRAVAAPDPTAWLENGDHLTREEFERRYQAMPWLKKAELIEGVVYMSSPLRYRHHARPHSQIMTWLGYYAAHLPEVDVADNATLRLDASNEVQPDALMRIDERAGGQSRTTEDDYLAGAPELVVEVASSSVSYDGHEKRRVYCRNGVAEYLLWLVEDQRLDWFRLCDGRFKSLEADSNGVLTSQVFPGLWLNTSALLEMRMQDVLATAAEGLQTPEHLKFKQQLVGHI
jgi:Uma2 family endonuclease